MGKGKQRPACAMAAAALALPLADQNTRRIPLNTRTESYVPRQMRHNLLVLPYYGVIANLEFRVNGSTVTLLGQVTRPTLKSEAERVVKDVEASEG
jgi:hypothetical protein